MGGISSSIVAWVPNELTTGRQAVRWNRRMITSPSSEEGNIKTYNLVLQISRLMTQLGIAWQELARSVRDSSLTMPKALPQMVGEKIKGLYQSFEKGVA